MKLLIASDIHGSLPAVKAVADAAARERADKLVLLGDLYYHGPRNPLPEGYDPKAVAAFLNAYTGTLIVIKGNCDAEVDETISDFPFLATAKLTADGIRYAFTHGQHGVGDSEQGADIVFSGHTHLYGITRAEGSAIIVNPGSPALPKGCNPPTYAVAEKGKIYIRTLDGKTVEEGTL